SLLVFVIVRDHVWWPPRDRGPSAEARIPAAAAALFFALAPLNSQPVDFMWARSALLCGTLYLGAFLAFVRRRWSLGAVLFALARLVGAARPARLDRARAARGQAVPAGDFRDGVVLRHARARVVLRGSLRGRQRSPALHRLGARPLGAARVAAPSWCGARRPTS